MNWDICMRYEGYPVDTSRTRVVGKASANMQRAYQASLLMSAEVIEMVAPGVQVQDLVARADAVARQEGFELWDAFLGHGLGLDVHCRPDMGREKMLLAKNMVITVEPRVTVDGEYLVGNEDMVLVTGAGSEALTHFAKEPLEL